MSVKLIPVVALSAMVTLPLTMAAFGAWSLCEDEMNAVKGGCSNNYKITIELCKSGINIEL